MASSTTKPTATASAISVRLLIEKPAAHIAAHVPASDSGTVMPAAIVGVERRKNTKTTDMTSRIVMPEGPLHVVHGSADRAGAVGEDRNVDAGRNPFLELRQQGFDAVDRFDDVGVRLSS